MEDNDRLMLFLLLAAVVLCIWFYRKYKGAQKEQEKMRKENSKLIADNALLEAEQLKFQLEPHTLKNMLANLQSVAFRLNKGMTSLSEILDYILYKGQNHLVSIKDEATFVQKYLELNDQFTSEIDAIKLDNSQLSTKSKHYHSACIPHLITAYFIENAFTHGDKYHPEFLKIQLKLSDTTFEMNVINQIKQKPNEKKGGIGLQNMGKRLDLLLSGKYEIKTSSDNQRYYSNLIIRF